MTKTTVTADVFPPINARDTSWMTTTTVTADVLLNEWFLSHDKIDTRMLQGETAMDTILDRMHAHLRALS